MAFMKDREFENSMRRTANDIPAIIKKRDELLSGEGWERQSRVQASLNTKLLTQLIYCGMIARGEPLPPDVQLNGIASDVLKLRTLYDVAQTKLL